VSPDFLPKGPHMGWLNQHHIMLETRWTARIMGALFVLLIVVLAVGEGVPHRFGRGGLSLGEVLGFAALIIVVAGMLVAWKWETVGGLLVLGGWTFFVVYGRQTFGLIFCWPLVTGLLFLACAWLRRRHQAVRRAGAGGAA